MKENSNNEREPTVESLKLTVHIPDFNVPKVNLPKLTRTLGDMMISIPNTLKIPHLEQPRVYFYYLTDECYTFESKYKLLDEVLTLFGRRRRDVEVIIVERDRIPTNLWDVILKGLGIEKYPALIVSKHPIGIEGLTEDVKEFKPATEYLKFERGLIADTLFEDREIAYSLITELADAAKIGKDLKDVMRRKEIWELLKKILKKGEEVIEKSVFRFSQ